jgi:segregation and condensation protein B
MESLKTVVEGLLFASDTPLSAEKLAEAFIEEVTLDEINGAIAEIRESCSREGRGFELREVAGGWQFRTRPLIAAYLCRLRKKSPSRLSRAAMETLAVVAYRQPVLRAEIEKIRGVDAGGVIRSLLERDLIKIARRSENLPGRPMLYATTKRFLETFDLPSLAELPSSDEMEKLLPQEREREREPQAPKLFDLE